MSQIAFGTLADSRMLTGPLETRRRLMGRAAEGGLDHVFVADHVSFFNGLGMDGLIQAATALALEPNLKVVVGVYLLALRHPVPTARQIATLCESAPGRLILGIGVGGEDRHEIEICGVDPRTRGRRTSESMVALRGLLSGEPYTHKSEFFEFDDALIRPRPDPPVPLIVGGRSDAAIDRAARHGDGWLGVWCSPRRYRDALAEIAKIAESTGRIGDGAGSRGASLDWKHGLQVWVGVDPDEVRARARLAEAMQQMYQIPYERFERYSPYGSVEKIADFLSGYIEAGCRMFNVMPVAESTEAGIDAVCELKRRLG
jgi:alkanesulfonate monooxygenase SsuD/methylene tetrahydromethanopterin reductase-like flavin-dependent oxidoreductase (luciferase family)